MENLGWISLHRKIQNHPDYFSEPFTRIMAWIDIILICNHKPATIYIRGNKIEIARGQFAWGERSLATRWKWSRGKIRRFLKDLENTQQIVPQKNNILSLYSVMNYEQYQQNETTERPQKDHNNNNNNIYIDNIDTKVSIQAKPVRVPKVRDLEIDAILRAFEEVNGTIPVDAKPRQWANHIKRLLSKYLSQANSSMKPHESLQKFLVKKKNAQLPITFNKLQTIYYHLKSVVYKNEKSKREQTKDQGA